MSPLAKTAVHVFATAEKLGVDHMAVGAIPAGAYGVPRATKDIDLLVSVRESDGVQQLIDGLAGFAEFEQQSQFDTLTWGKRIVGTTKSAPAFKIELFETFDDPFVVSEFDRRVRLFVPILSREIFLPTPEDVLVQKLRWARPKDLEDARDILAVQEPRNLDMAYVHNWCRQHGSEQRLATILEALPEF